MLTRRRRVAVAGSSGFLGAAVARRLERDAVNVVRLNRRRGFDLSSPGSLDSVTGLDAVAHLAGRTLVPASYDDAASFYRDNLLPTIHLLELARRNHARLALASSYVYGIPQRLPIDESHPAAALNPYMESKLLAERLCAAYNRDFGVPIVILRIFNAYGPGQREEFLIPKIVRGLMQGRIALGDPAPRRDFVYVDDVAEAFVAALNWTGSAPEIFNIGSGVSVSVEQVVSMLLRLSGRDVEVEFDRQTRPAEIPDAGADIRKAARLLGWTPRVDLESGLRRTWDAARTP
ncbi:MAG: NAD-dependent epimerase/dehydratase family protein [Bryobacteraceae bacterium]|nr:NAD-dependent epimerase/dehydratase family protein [Bryobacteraceae bacterium]